MNGIELTLTGQMNLLDKMSTESSKAVATST